MFSQDKNKKLFIANRASFKIFWILFFSLEKFQGKMNCFIGWLSGRFALLNQSLSSSWINNREGGNPVFFQEIFPEKKLTAFITDLPCRTIIKINEYFSFTQLLHHILLLIYLCNQFWIIFLVKILKFLKKFNNKIYPVKDIFTTMIIYIILGAIIIFMMRNDSFQIIHYYIMKNLFSDISVW